MAHNENDPGNGCLADIHEECSSMTVRIGSTLSMDEEGLSVSVWHPVDKDEYVARFLNEEMSTMVLKTKSNYKVECPQCEYFDGTTPLYEMARHVDEWARIAKGGFHKIYIEMAEWCPLAEFQPAHKIVKCSELAIRSDDEDTLVQWLNRIEDGPECISIKPGLNAMNRRIQMPVRLSKRFAELPIWSRPIEELIVMHWVPFSDEQFLRLQCKWFDILTATVSDEAFNRYLRMWEAGDLPNAKRFGITFDRPVDCKAILRGLLVVPWDASFQTTFPQLREHIRTGETKYTVFRTVNNEGRSATELECSNGTLTFDSEQGVYFEVLTYNRECEQRLLDSQKPRATTSSE